MQQIKIFKGMEHDIATLETEMNQWLSQNDVNVIQMTGNIAPQSECRDSSSKGLGNSSFVSSDVMIVLLYSTKCIDTV